MNDPAKVRAVLGFNRNNKTIAPNRNQLILKHLSDTRRTNHRIKLLANPHLSSAQLTAYLSQLRTGGIKHLGTIINTALNLFLQRLLLTEHIAQHKQQLDRFFLMKSSNEPFNPARAFQRCRNT
ncbi:hypothetical protein D3C77_518140 [compost metagenome]